REHEVARCRQGARRGAHEAGLRLVPGRRFSGMLPLSVKQSANRPTRFSTAMQNRSLPPQTPARKIVRLWQSHNQRRWELEKDVLLVDERAPFVCECTSDACLRPVALTMHEYEAAHMCPNWYAVLPGHLMPDDGARIVIRQPHFWVVELSPLWPSSRIGVRRGLVGRSRWGVDPG